MLLRLTKLIDSPGQLVSFQTSLDLSDLDFGGVQLAAEPIEASGQVKNTAGVLLLTAQLSTTLHCVCDRCAKPFLLPFRLPVNAVLTASEDEEDESSDEWTFSLTDDCADLDEILTTAFVFGVPAKLLCSEDCQGLCPICGADLNNGPCGCKKPVDPRLAALAQLLEDPDTTS